MAKRRLRNSNGRFTRATRRARSSARGAYTRMRRYTRRPKKLSIARVAGWAFPLQAMWTTTKIFHSGFGGWNLSNNFAGWTYAVWLAALQTFLGYVRTASGQSSWKPSDALQFTYLPIIGGEVAHRVANRFGVNRNPVIKRIPMVQI